MPTDYIKLEPVPGSTMATVSPDFAKSLNRIQNAADPRESGALQAIWGAG
jgi:hypothetical protein